MKASNVVPLRNEPEPEMVDVKLPSLHVYVVGGGYEYIRMLYDLGYTGAKGVGDADFVLFTGGEDVSPALYGEKALRQTNSSEFRDRKEKAIYEAALEAGLPMVGICRGGQFLNVMNGGKMWQHVNNHCGNHAMTIIGKVDRTIEVTSTHHQMMIPNEKEVLILATAGLSTEKFADGIAAEIKDPLKQQDDMEVLWYEKTNCLCFQPHPEFGNAPKECRDYFEECLDNFIVPYVQDNA